MTENLKGLERVCLIDGDTRVANEIKCIMTRGHSRAHQSKLIESRGESAFYVGEMAG